MGYNALTTPVGLSGTTFNGNLVPATYPALTPPVIPPPGNFSVSIAGHNYNVDTSLDFYRRTAFKHTSIPAQRDSLNFDNSSGENVVNTAGLWRRSGQNWALGAGQKFYDAKQSNPDRYFTSKGINPWISHQLSLLQDTTNSGSLAYSAGANTLVQTMTAGTYTYYLESGQLKFRDGTGAVSAAVSGLPSGAGVSYTSICHNGSYWFLACQTGGIYYGLLGGSSGSKYVNTNGTYAGYALVEWANDRLFAAGGNSSTGYAGPYLFAFQPDHTAGSAPGVNDVVTSNITSPTGSIAQAGGGGAFNTTWVWSAICQGTSQVYACGYNLINGQKSDGAVYRTGNEVGTGAPAAGMSYPIRALPMAAGEYPTALYPYLNYIFVGTNLGARMCQTLSAYDPNANGSGDLKAGPIVPGINYQTNQPSTSFQSVTAFIGYKQYVWFTWSNYDTTSTGIGRMDLTNFIDDLAPAYASDLMVTGQGTVDLDWDYTQNAPLISVLGAGGKVYQQSANLVASGTFTSGQISYDIPENKTALYMRITAPNMAGSVQASITADNGSPILLGTFVQGGISYNYDPSEPMPIPSSDNFAGLTGKQFNVTLTLLSAGNQSPVLSRWQLDALPQVASETNIMVVLSPYPDSVVEGADTWYDPYAEYYYLDNIRRNAQIVWYVEGNLSARVIIESVEWCPERQRADYQKGYLGLIVATLKTINGFTYQQPSLK